MKEGIHPDYREVLFVDMSNDFRFVTRSTIQTRETAEFNGKKYNVDLLNDQSLWDAAPIEPKTPPNPLKNDKEFLTEFPYIAPPWE